MVFVCGATWWTTQPVLLLRRSCGCCVVAVAEVAVSGPASRRWRLFYTLLKNPQLILLRKHHLSSPSAHQVALKARNMAMQQAQSSGVTPALVTVQVVPSEDC